MPDLRHPGDLGTESHVVTSNNLHGGPGGVTHRVQAPSPRVKARIAGALWLIVIVTGGFAVLARSALIVRTDAAATASNILAFETRFRLAFVADLIGSACYLWVTLLLYELLKPVSRTVSLAGASFGLVGVAVGTAISLNYLAPILLLQGTQPLSAFDTSQLRAEALVFLRLHREGYNVGMVFFGVQIVTIGYLIARSRLVPRFLGMMLVIGGSGYVAGSFANFLLLPFAPQLSQFVLLAAFIGEGSLTLWLLMRGVDVQRMDEQLARVS